MSAVTLSEASIKSIVARRANQRMFTIGCGQSLAKRWLARSNSTRWGDGHGKSHMGSYIILGEAAAEGDTFCRRGTPSWDLGNDGYSLPENWTHMLRSRLSGTALVSQDVRARPVAQGAAVEAQIPTEVLRQDQSRSSLHHEGGAGKAALPVPRRNVYRAQNRGWSCPDSRNAASTVAAGFLSGAQPARPAALP
jgi:hypothetical protein